MNQLSHGAIRFGFALLAMLVAAEAVACSCGGEVSVEKAFESADAIFAGVVVSIEDPAGDRIRALPEHERALAFRTERTLWGPEWGRKVSFRVMQWWKSEAPGEQVEVWTGYDGGGCGYPVEEGKSYLVYARRDAQNRFTFSICGRSAALVCGLEDVRKLGEPIKSYETFDSRSLIEREQPYTTYWRPCIEQPLLLGERGLRMDKHCRFKVEGVISRDGTIRDFEIISGAGLSWMCPDSLRDEVRRRVEQWRFRPATLAGEPVEAQLTSVSMSEPVTEAEYAKALQKRAERKARESKRP